MFDIGKYQEAIPYYDKVLEIDPNNVNALSFKGLSLNRLGDYIEALKYFDKALIVNPRNIDI